MSAYVAAFANRSRRAAPRRSASSPMTVNSVAIPK